MEYYTYISETKIDMLHGQIPLRHSGVIATKGSVGISGVASVERTSTPGAPTVYSKLAVVTDALKKQQQLGTLEDAVTSGDRKFVLDEGRWKSLLIGKSYDEDLQKDPLSQGEPQPTSYLVFCERNGIIVLLVASPRNVLGASGVNYCLISPSFTIDDYIKQHSPYFWDSNDESAQDRDSVARACPGALWLMAWLWNTPEKDSKVFFRVYDCHRATTEICDEVKRCEDTYNVRMLNGDLRSVIIGSPISVALA